MKYFIFIAITCCLFNSMKTYADSIECYLGGSGTDKPGLAHISYKDVKVTLPSMSLVYTVRGHNLVFTMPTQNCIVLYGR